jgi:outer membrane lipoprotein SlyB
MRNGFISLFMISLIIAGSFITGCQNKAEEGAGIGALVGAGLGQAIGRNTKSTLIGGAIGAGAGYLIGQHEQNQEVQQHPEQFTEVEFTNSDGTNTVVALRKSDGGYIGPDKEYYRTLPTPDELKTRYGH